MLPTAVITITLTYEEFKAFYSSLAVIRQLTGRARATAAIAEWAEGCQGSRPELDPEFRTGKRFIAELMSIATAVALNSVPDLELHLATAQQSGVTAEQISRTEEMSSTYTNCVYNVLFRHSF